MNTFGIRKQGLVKKLLALLEVKGSGKNALVLVSGDPGYYFGTIEQCQEGSCVIRLSDGVGYGETVSVPLEKMHRVITALDKWGKISLNCCWLILLMQKMGNRRRILFGKIVDVTTPAALVARQDGSCMITFEAWSQNGNTRIEIPSFDLVMMAEVYTN